MPNRSIEILLAAISLRSGIAEELRADQGPFVEASVNPRTASAENLGDVYWCSDYIYYIYIYGYDIYRLL